MDRNTEYSLTHTQTHKHVCEPSHLLYEGREGRRGRVVCSKIKAMTHVYKIRLTECRCEKIVCQHVVFRKVLIIMAGPP